MTDTSRVKLGTASISSDKEPPKGGSHYGEGGLTFTTEMLTRRGICRKSSRGVSCREQHSRGLVVSQVDFPRPQNIYTNIHTDICIYMSKVNLP